MIGKTSLFAVVSALAFTSSVSAFATTGCYPAGAITAITTGLLTITTTGITTPQACAVSSPSSTPASALLREQGDLTVQDRSEAVNRAYAYFNGNTNICYSTNLQPLLGATTDSVSTLIGGVGETICNDGDLQVRTAGPHWVLYFRVHLTVC